jgi:hypothetical protein
MNDGHQRKIPPFSSNAERLTIREWLGLLLVLLVLAVVAGPIWSRLEGFEPSADYRIPYDLSEDYWLFDRYCREAGESEKSFVIGDSFVWGQYVRKDETLSFFLNQQAGAERFVNAGLDGTHPLALEGLIKHSCAGLSDREVVLHLNLLWVSSPQADLQLERGFQFNHPRLVPQFAPTIPSYEAPVSKRLGIVLARHLPFLDLSRHIQIAYYSNTDLPHWTMDNPYLNPFRQVNLTLPESEDPPHPNAQAWFVEGAVRQSLPWVDVESSLQWQAFQRLVDVLQARGNRLFVLVGPLNEHMLEFSNQAVYRGILAYVESWLHDRNLPYYTPPVLPSDLYADMSHPLGRGYAFIAQDLWERLSG